MENPENDKKARMNKFFEEMNSRIEAEETIKKTTEQPTTQVPPTKKTFVDGLENLQNKTDELPPIPPLEEKQTFLEALKELKKELDPKADALVDTTFTKVKDLYGKVENEAKNLFNQFDTYTDGLEQRLKEKDDEYENWKKSRSFKHNTGDSLFEGTGGLFEKAEKFIKSSKEQATKNEGTVKITTPDKSIKKTINPNDTVYGFEDLDGDGNPLIDDAIVEE